MQFCLIRHGSTAGNLEHRYIGSTDEELTKDAVWELAENTDRYPRPDCVFASPLKRCVQTAQLLYPELSPEILSELRECEFGEFEYKNYQELCGDARYQAWIDSGGTLAFPGGESREAFEDRCCAAFAKGCRRALERGKRFPAFVVHGGTIMAVLDRFSSPHADYFSWQVKNTEGYTGTVDFSADGEICGLTDLERLPLPARTGIEDQYVKKKNQKLRCGYTTGSCAAAAAKAAARMLFAGKICRRAELMTPKGILLHLPVEEPEIAWHDAAGVLLEDSAGAGTSGGHGQKKAGSDFPGTAGKIRYAECAVRKYAGDDPDATDGILIFARAELVSAGKEYDAGSEETVHESGERKERAGSAEKRGSVRSCREASVMIEGGAGVGRVTKPGLEQPVGAAAINRVPREMITREVRAVCEEYGYSGTVRITVSVPEGEEIAKKTFNPHIGILGGISILGTSGIVMPMSEEALIASIRVEMKQKIANGERYLLVTPGNYGADFIRRKELSEALDAEHSMKCSNYVGETVDMAAELGAEGILFVAHIGKFIKVSGGIMNTHSAQADCRAELMAAQAMRAGASPETVRSLLDTNTTEEAVEILSCAGILHETIRETADRIWFHLQKRCRGEIRTEVILFSNRHGYLGETAGADEMMRRIIRGTDPAKYPVREKEMSGKDDSNEKYV